MLTHLLRCACQTSIPCRPPVVPKALFAACAPHVYSTTATATTLQLRIPQYMVWGANTDVGKTLVSAGLAAAARRNKVCTDLSLASPHLHTLKFFLLI